RDWQSGLFRTSVASAKSASRTQLSHAEKDLAELDWLAVLGHDFGNDAAGFRLDFVPHFHRLDNANDRVLVHFCSNIDKRGRVRRGRLVKRADHWGNNIFERCAFG